MALRLALLALAPLLLLCQPSSHEVLKAQADNAWDVWLAQEHEAARYGRTRAELVGFTQSCKFLAHYWKGVADQHKSLERVIVLDVRHNWCEGVALLLVP
jgi:hypothetical protein